MTHKSGPRLHSQSQAPLDPYEHNRTRHTRLFILRRAIFPYLSSMTRRASRERNFHPISKMSMYRAELLCRPSEYRNSLQVRERESSRLSLHTPLFPRLLPAAFDTFDVVYTFFAFPAAAAAAQPCQEMSKKLEVEYSSSSSSSLYVPSTRLAAGCRIEGAPNNDR